MKLSVISTPADGTVMLDCTLNGGGHAAAIVARGARVLGIEWDPVSHEHFFTNHPELVDYGHGGQ